MILYPCAFWRMFKMKFCFKIWRNTPSILCWFLRKCNKRGTKWQGQRCKSAYESFLIFPFQLENEDKHCQPGYLLYYYITVYIFFYPQRKLLAVYLHHDGSILSNVFCSQILCSESVVNYLSSNFITWAWDMTHETNCARY